LKRAHAAAAPASGRCFDDAADRALYAALCRSPTRDREFLRALGVFSALLTVVAITAGAVLFELLR